MFLESSRYASVGTIVARTRDGREVTAVKLRRLPAESGVSLTIVRTDRLDITARRRYGDPTRYWHIADANTELEAAELDRPGRVIQAPET